jgi:hypothetical protein
MAQEDVLVFPDAGAGRAASSIDPNLLLAFQNNGGFGGGNGAWWWIMFMWMMWDRNGRNGNFNDYLASVNGNEGRQYLADIMNGRFDNLNNLANMLNTSVEGIKSGVFGIQNAITQVAGQIGMSGLQTINAIQAGNTSILSKLCECCCENRLAICQQTNALQSTLAANHADDILQAEKNAAGLQLQLAQLDGADKLAICQQTNTLQNQAERDTNAILNAISGQNTLITKEFCDLKERELQNKIDTQGDIITQLRNQISNDKQTLQFNAAFHALDDKIDAIAAKQPNTVPVQWPNLVGVNATPYIGQGYYPGGNFGGWGSGFGGGIVY